MYIGEWVAGVQSGLGFKWSGLGTKAQFGRWLDNKFVQTLYVAPAILAKMPSWSVEEFTHELETRWADYQRPTAATAGPNAAALGPAGAAGAAGGAMGGANGANGGGAAGHAGANGLNGANGNHAGAAGSKGGNKKDGGKSGVAGSSSSHPPACICHCAYKCQCKCVCPCVACSAASQADEWAPEVFELIKRMRAAHDIEPHMLTAASGHKFREE